MADTFSVQLPGNWRERWPEIEAAAYKFHFEFQKDDDHITFSGFGIAGLLILDGDIAVVTIEKHPFFLSAACIEETVRGFLLKQQK